jgi:hypothetical protein
MASPKSESLPSPTFTVPSSGHELRMSYGMFNDIMRLVGNPQDAMQLLITDSVTRDLVIRRLFTDNKKSIDKVEELTDSFEIEVLPSEIDGIVGWVADHCAHFLLSTGRAMMNVETKYKSQMDEVKEKASLNQSSSGSES